MLKITNVAHFNKVMQEAAKLGQAHWLQEKLGYLHTYSDPGGNGQLMVVELSHDLAPLSFALTWLRMGETDSEGKLRSYPTPRPWMNGGLIFHADDIERGENCWSVHT